MTDEVPGTEERVDAKTRADQRAGEAAAAAGPEGEAVDRTMGVLRDEHLAELQAFPEVGGEPEGG
jgi:hypothetical protein